MKNLLTIANAITIFGMILAIWTNVVAFSLSGYLEQIWLFTVLFLITGSTDYLDGYFARKRKGKTQIGALLDRLRDKIFVCPLFVILLSQQPLRFQGKVFSLFFTTLICCTLFVEGCLLISALVGIVKEKDLSAHKYGKRKMLLQFITLSIWIFSIWVNLRLTVLSCLLSYLSYLVLLILLASVIYGCLSLIGYLERYF